MGIWLIVAAIGVVVTAIGAAPDRATRRNQGPAFGMLTPPVPASTQTEVTHLAARGDTVGAVLGEVVDEVDQVPRVSAQRHAMGSMRRSSGCRAAVGAAPP